MLKSLHDSPVSYKKHAVISSLLGCFKLFVVKGKLVMCRVSKLPVECYFLLGWQAEGDNDDDEDEDETFNPTDSDSGEESSGSEDDDESDWDDEDDDDESGIVTVC